MNSKYNNGKSITVNLLYNTKFEDTNISYSHNIPKVVFHHYKFDLDDRLNFLLYDGIILERKLDIELLEQPI